MPCTMSERGWRYADALALLIGTVGVYCQSLLGFAAAAAAADCGFFFADRHAGGRS